MVEGDSSKPVEELGAAPRPRRFGILRKWSAFEFLISLLLLVVVTPFVEDLRLGPLVEAVLLTFVLASAVLAVSDRRAPLLVAMSLALLAVAARWTQHFQPERLPPAIYLSPALALLGFVLVQYFRYILRAPVVTFVVLCAATSTYLMLGLLWAMAYLLVASSNPNAFALSAAPNATNVMTGFNAFYFSFVTLSTVGYGDIVPVSRVARMLAAMEATTGTLYVAMLIARLVSMHASTQPNRK
ncbi:MAG TPA: ion channel [Planctomycetaceae bacterium]|nr:ion channel [Planctomycetaceae bacterium]